MIRQARGCVVIVALGAILVMPSMASGALNVLVNPSFEEFSDWGEGPKPNGWGFWGLTWSVDAWDVNATLPPLDGDRMELAMGPWWCEWCNSGIVQAHPASEGQVWEVSGYTYVPTAWSIAGTSNFMAMKIEFLDQGGGFLAQPELIVADGSTVEDEWHFDRMRATAPAGTATAQAVWVIVQPAWEIGGAMIDAAEFGRVVPLDILPNDCPNQLTANVRSNGRLPIAIGGTDYFNVVDINLDTVAINGDIFPVKATIGSVISAVPGDLCECQVAGDDGIDDLMLHFSRRQVVSGLGLVGQIDQIVPVTVEGLLNDGTPFSATDCVEVLAPSKK